ncbi:MAG: molybdopterin-dependent oxidoreductase [Rhizobiaceae bacterium]|nr:molybdopterin-dependent oxidoreductase [Rhizobiaceae bacterium]
MTMKLSRRGFLTGSAVGLSGVALSGCDALDFVADRDGKVRGILEGANSLTYRVQRLLMSPDRLAPEFTQADIRQPMRPNGVTSPQDEHYLSLVSGGFSAYRLEVTGLVDNPLSLDLETIRAIPSRTQITRHDCVEGWSCIAKWTGAPLRAILDEARVKPQARFVVFHCLDTIERSLSGEVKYYESIDMIDARHPQTILAYGLNDAALPVENGAPLRVRVERQLGYKMAKYVRGIELVDDLTPFGLGKGGYWEDRGYEWYAGI